MIESLRTFDDFPQALHRGEVSEAMAGEGHEGALEGQEADDVEQHADGHKEPATEDAGKAADPATE